MTPAERARQIEAEETAAERAAVRARAVAYTEARRALEAEKVQAWMRSPSENITLRLRSVRPVSFDKRPAATDHKRGRIGKQYSAFGESRSLPQWADHSGISLWTLRRRLIEGWTLERAVTEPLKDAGRKKKHHHGGCQQTSRNSQGTGGGSDVRHLLGGNDR